MNKLILLGALFLSACGGGEVNCTAENACVYNITVNGGITSSTPVASIPLVPQPAASVPSGAASDPAPSVPPVSTVPLAKLKTLFPVTTAKGDLVFTAQGMTYLVAIVTNGDATWVALYSAGSIGDAVQMTNSEAMLDSGFDLRGIAPDDDSLRAYLSTRIVPALDDWMRTHADRFASGMQLPAVNKGGVPTGSAADRLAGRMPQWIDITPFGAYLK